MRRSEIPFISLKILLKVTWKETTEVSPGATWHLYWRTAWATVCTLSPLSGTVDVGAVGVWHVTGKASVNTLFFPERSVYCGSWVRVHPRLTKNTDFLYPCGAESARSLVKRRVIWAYVMVLPSKHVKRLTDRKQFQSTRLGRQLSYLNDWTTTDYWVLIKWYILIIII